MDGKRNDWEGIVILPTIDHKILLKEYKKQIKSIEQVDKSRNRVDQSRIYKKSKEFFEYKSFYGNLSYNVSINELDL